MVPRLLIQIPVPDNTPSSNNEDNNTQSANASNNPEEYDDLNELVDDIKNSDVDADQISLNAFKDSGAYQGADQDMQDCIDLAGKIGDNLRDNEIVRCSEDTNFFQNQIANNNNDNTNNDNTNNDNTNNDNTNNDNTDNDNTDNDNTDNDDNE